MWNGVKWVEPENYHVTLLFLGSVNKNRINSIIRSGVKIFENFKSFKISAASVSVFGPLKAPKVFVCRIDNGTDELRKLNSSISAELSAYLPGVKDKHRYIPHITLGRGRRSGVYARRADNLFPENPDFPGKISFTADKIVLFSSVLETSGAKYESVYIWKLKQQEKIHD